MKMLVKLPGNCLSLRNTTYPLIVKLYGQKYWATRMSQ